MMRFAKKILLLILWLLYFASLYFLLRIYYADVNFKKSQNLLRTNEAKRALLYADRSISLNSYEENYFRGRAKVNTVLLVGSENTDLLKNSILLDLEKANDLNTNNLVVIRNSVPIYYFLAVKDIYLESGRDNIDEVYINVVKKFFEDTKKSYWNDAGVVSLIAKYEKKLGLDDEYNKSRERVRVLRPDLLNWSDSFR